MDNMPAEAPMNPPPHPPLAGLDPADLLREGAAADTLADGAALSFQPPSLEEMAALFPRFEILGLVGQGGMGAVYRVRQLDLDRVVALKILPPSIGATPGFSARFAREARALAKLNHPAIVTLHEFGQTDSDPPLPFILMEFVDGVNLAQLMKTGRIAPREALAIVPQICDALQYAHDHGIVHRDIKPENILLDRLGRVKVADFGIAKVIEAVSDDAAGNGGTSVPADATIAGKIIGTPQYMAPEQISRPAEVDHRADIYALGVVFYQMLTGELPEKNLQAPSRKVSIDVRLDEIVLRAMEDDPELRYQQASVMKTKVETVAELEHVKNDSQEPPFAIPPQWLGYEYKSKRTFRGLPVLHVTSGIDPKTGLVRHSRGIVAIGGIATGWLAMGGRAYGGIAFGGIAVGGLAFGGMAAGLVSFGGMSIALIAALGGLAIAPVAIGGLALGYLAIGGQATGVQHMDARNYNPEALRQFYRSYQSQLFAVLGGIWLLALGSMAVIAAWARKQATIAAISNPTPAAAKRNRILQRRCWVGIALIVCLPLSVAVAFDRRAQEPVSHKVEYRFTVLGNRTENEVRKVVDRAVSMNPDISAAHLPNSSQWKVSAVGTNQETVNSQVTRTVDLIRRDLNRNRKRVLSEPMTDEELRSISSVVTPWQLAVDFLGKLRIYLVIGLSCATAGLVPLIGSRSRSSSRGKGTVVAIVAALVVWLSLAKTVLYRTNPERVNERDPWRKLVSQEHPGETPADMDPDEVSDHYSEETRNAVREWLGWIDEGDYRRAWNDLSELTHALQTDKSWESSLRASRNPLGTVLAREWIGGGESSYLGSMKQFPNRTYRFQTEFSNGSATESVTLIRESNGDLRVMNYSIERQQAKNDDTKIPAERVKTAESTRDR